MEDLLNILKEMKPDVDFEKCEDLMEAEYLTSFDIVMLISLVSQEMGITIPANEVVPENFKSVQTIQALLDRLEEE